MIHEATARARAYVEKIPGAVQGQGGDNLTFQVAVEDALGEMNADTGESLGWIISPKTRRRWKEIPRVSSTNYKMLFDDGLVNGYPAAVTNQIADNNQAVFGKFDSMTLLFWGKTPNAEIFVDPYTQAASGKCRIILHIYFNVLIQHPQAFCASTDAANQ